MSEEKTTAVQAESEKTAAENMESTAAGSTTSKWKWYVAAVVIVGLILAGVLYVLEKEGRSSTGIFDSLISKQEAGKVVAVVNGTEIINSELATSVQQFSQAAAAQGVDLSTPEAQGEIRAQALEVLVNTQLLKDEAAKRGITVSDEELTNRLAEIETQIGGPEVLAQRMAELQIDDAKLQKDIRDELLIQALLTQLFTEAAIEVTEEEIAAVYEGAGGIEAGLPALEEVREQVVAQIRSSKEQEVIDTYLVELKETASIEIK